MAALAVLGATEALLWLALVEQWRAIDGPGPASLDEALTLVVVAIAVALGAWLLVSTAASLLAHLPGRLGSLADRWARAWAPACARRVAAVLVGAAVTGALAPGTALGNGTAGPPVTGPEFTQTAQSTPGPGFSTTRRAIPPQPGWTPSRPVQRPQPPADLVTGRSPAAAAAEVVVHRGDTLWGIVRRQLGPDATDAEVAHAWPAWYDANRVVIGDDPDLLLPGQVLRRPSAAAAESAESAR